MSDFDRKYGTTTGLRGGQAVAIDAGLRAYMMHAYNYMAVGVGLTGVVAWVTFRSAVMTSASGAITGLTAFGQAIFGGPAIIVLMLGTLGMVIFISLSGRLIEVILANPVMIDAYRAGIPGDGKPFPDGSKMAKIHWNAKQSAEAPSPTTVPDTLYDTDFMVRDSKRFLDTGQ
jgi:hypothetical protein